MAEAAAFLRSEEASAALHLYLASLDAGKVMSSNGSANPVAADGTEKPTAARAASVPPGQPTYDPEVPLLSDASTTPAAGPAASERFYITTAINYTNGDPHMGHAYEAITTDVIARYNRMYGRDVFFLTGTDEHGQKIANTAAGLGIRPIDICDKYAAAFKALNRILRISNNYYIRTTMPHHHEVSQELWRRCAAAGDIYLSKYEGWYNEREETFVSESEAKMSEYKDPVSGLPLKKMEEKSYFFRMSKYKQALVEHINANPNFILPEARRNFILARLEEDLLDLSVSRTTFDWGIPVPPGFEEDHVMYVWFDALSNYLSGVHALQQGHELSPFWPANVHCIGKDIIWFHTVIWPTILMSAGVPLPKSVFAHGFVNAKDGRKMSKSIGNVVNPYDVINKVPVDSFRYYLIKDPLGGDVNFNEDMLVAVHNGELADVLGNLVHRALNLCHKFCGGVVPDLDLAEGWGHTRPFDLESLRTKVEEAMTVYSIKVLGDEVMSAVRDTNKFLTEAEPWKLKGDHHEDARKRIVRLTMEAVYIMAHFLAPIIPYAATSILQKLGTSYRPIPTLDPSFINLAPGTPVTVGEILFVKLERGDAEGENGGAEGGAKMTKASAAQQQQQPGSTNKGGGKSQPATPADQPDFSKIDLRVGLITKVCHHPNADRLFCEEIDVGEGAPRQIASGLREHYKLEDLQSRLVVVVTNLKEAKLAGFASNGMVLAASDGSGRVELVQVPEGAQVGERVGLQGPVDTTAFAGLAPNAVKKQKVWELISAELKTDENGGVVYKGQAVTTKAGPCFAPSVVSGVVR